MIHLCAIVEALEIQPDEAKTYLNRQTDEIALISHEEMSAAEEDAAVEDFPEWQRENIRTAIAILETDHYVELPGQREIHEWSIMRNFCDSLEDGRVRDALLSAVHGKGAFHYFKATLDRYGIEERWHRFRTEALQHIAREWLAEHEIPYQDE